MSEDRQAYISHWTHFDKRKPFRTPKEVHDYFSLANMARLKKSLPPKEIAFTKGELSFMADDVIAFGWNVDLLEAVLIKAPKSLWKRLGECVNGDTIKSRMAAAELAILEFVERRKK